MNIKISVIHPARNENTEIEETYKSMLSAGASEIFIYDDGSDVPLPQFSNTNIIRHDISKGPSVCRNLGGYAATGEVLVFADAHTRIDDLTSLARFSIDNNCVVIPSMTSLYGSGNVIGYSRNFVLKGQENELIGFDMYNQKPESRYSICTGNWGGFFIMPKSLFLHIGGWIDHHYWGYNDPSLILKNFFCGKHVVLDRDIIYKHKGKVKTGFGYPVKAVEPLLNLFHSYFVIFDKETFENHWLPKLEKSHKWMFNRGIDHISQQSIINEERYFKTVKIKDDDEFFKTFLNDNQNGKPYV